VVRLSAHRSGYDPRVSEPQAVADRAEEFLPGAWHWSVADERIGGFVSSSHAFLDESGVVLVDPLPLARDAEEPLGKVLAICLTTSGHQRSAWRLRRELGVHVWAPANVREVEEEPDERYSEGDVLPGGSRAIFMPGPGTAQHGLLLERGGGVLFTSDLFVHPAGSELRFVPGEYMHDPEQARRTAEGLLDLDFAVLCTGHGAPVTDDPKAAIRGALSA
jgi:glyoxylase-like metal-dependent hydrolase (beta-lactamase superfamily II)